MIVEIYKRYDQGGDQFFLRSNIEFTDQDNPAVRQIIEREFMGDFTRTLRNHFETQKVLYELIDDRFLANEYNPDGGYFNTDDNGFAQFVRDLTQSDTDRFNQAYFDIIRDRVGHVQEMFQQQYRARLSTDIMNTGEPIELDKINFANQPIFMVGNQVYGMQLTQLQGNGVELNTIEDIGSLINNTVLENAKTQMETMKRNYDRRLAREKEKNEREKNILIVEALQDTKDILDNWEFVDHNNHLYFKYKRRIVTDKISYAGHIYDYPGAPDFKEMYVDGLKVKVKAFISSSDVTITRGYNVHFQGTSDSGCMGTLSGQPLFTVLRELPEVLRVANMDSPNNNSISSEISRTFLEKENVADYRRNDPVWRVRT